MQVRLYSDEHAGLFISNKRPPMVLALLEGIPHYLLLEDDVRPESFASTHAKKISITRHRSFDRQPRLDLMLLAFSNKMKNSEKTLNPVASA